MLGGARRLEESLWRGMYDAFLREAAHTIGRPDGVPLGIDRPVVGRRRLEPARRRRIFAQPRVGRHNADRAGCWGSGPAGYCAKFRNVNLIAARNSPDGEDSRRQAASAPRFCARQLRPWCPRHRELREARSPGEPPAARCDDEVVRAKLGSNCITSLARVMELQMTCSTLSVRVAPTRKTRLRAVDKSAPPPARPRRRDSHPSFEPRLLRGNRRMVQLSGYDLGIFVAFRRTPSTGPSRVAARFRSARIRGSPIFFPSIKCPSWRLGLMLHGNAMLLPDVGDERAEQRV